VHASAYPGWSPYTVVGQTRPFAYGYNPRIHDTNKWGGKISRIPSPSKIVMMGEVNDSESMSTSITPVAADNVKTPYRVNRKGAANYLFCDGHVETLVGNQSEAALAAAGKTNIWRWW
jgi:prepilin-type processing-associated H-X9-DG protein